MANRNRRLPPPDLNDPFRRPEEPRQVHCIHCSEQYCSSEIKWDGRSELWVCKHHPKCDGAGHGIDTHDVSPNDED